jgi:hypothetical protein
MHSFVAALQQEARSIRARVITSISMIFFFSLPYKLLGLFEFKYRENKTYGSGLHMWFMQSFSVPLQQEACLIRAQVMIHLWHKFWSTWIELVGGRERLVAVVRTYILLI